MLWGVACSLTFFKEKRENHCIFSCLGLELVMPASAQDSLNCFSIFNIWGNYIQGQKLRKVAKFVTVKLRSQVGRVFLLHTGGKS